MRKLLTATTALALVGGAASAELSMSGDAELGVDYDSSAGAHESKHSFAHEVGIDFSGSGTTDGGLSFGGSAGFDTGDDTVNTGTVFISGSFGKITIGDNDAADLLAGGIADVGLNGVGVDDVAESVRGQTAKAFRYDNSFGQISVAISAGTSAGTAKVDQADGVFGYSIPGDEGTLPSWSRLYTADAPNNMLSATELTGYTSAVNAAMAARHEGATFEVTGESATFDPDGTETDFDADDLAGYYLGDDGKVYDETDAEVDEEFAAAWMYLASAYALNEDGTLTVADGAIGEATPAAFVSKAATAEVPGTGSDNQYAFGMSFEASGVTVGIGYDSEKTISLGIGFTTGDISTNLLYAKGEDATGTMDTTGMGADMSYTFGASTLTLAYARQETDMHGGVTHDAVGMNVGHDLGGGASVVAGFGRVESRDDDAGGMVSSANKASAGLKFSF